MTIASLRFLLGRFFVGYFSLDFSGGTLKVHRVGDFLGATWLEAWTALLDCWGLVLVVPFQKVEHFAHFLYKMGPKQS